MGLFSAIGSVIAPGIGTAIGAGLDAATAKKGGGGGGGSPGGGGGSPGGGGGSTSYYQNQFDPNVGLANLYLAQAATKLGPAKSALDIVTGEFAQSQAPYYAGLGTELGIRGQAASDQWGITREKALGEAALTLGLASQYGGLAEGALGERGTAMNQLGLLGPTVQANLAQAYGTQAANLEKGIIEGERGLLQPTATALAQSGLDSLKARTQAANNLLSSNLAIRLKEQDTMNALALKRADIQGNLALRRDARGAAGAAAKAIA